MVRMWVLEGEGDATVLKPRAQIKIDSQALLDTCPTCGEAACVRAVHRVSKDTLLVALGSGVLCSLMEGQGGEATTTVLMEGHSCDGIRCLAWHPTLALLATIGHDNVLKLWDRELRSCVGRGAVQEPLSLAFAPDGAVLLVGLGSGKLSPLSAHNLQGLSGFSIPKVYSRKGISAVSFAPNGRMLAAGSVDSIIYVYKYVPQTSLTIRSMCSGTLGAIIGMDWSGNSDFIMSNTDALELALWQINSVVSLAAGRTATT